MDKLSRKGFTLVELLVVIAILAIIITLSFGGYSMYVRYAKSSRCHDKIKQVETAIMSLKTNTGWNPELIAGCANGEGLLDKNVAAVFARNGDKLTQSHTGSGSSVKLTGEDRFGVVTIWAEEYIEANKNANLSDKLPGGGSIKDHIFRYAIDKTGRGTTRVLIGGKAVTVRKSAAVWCCGPNGEFEPYGEAGSDDIYSWTEEQVVE